MSDRKIEDAIRKLSGTYKEDRLYLVYGTVKSVSEDQATCTAEISGVDVPNIRLQAAVCDGWLLVPKVNSTITVLYSLRINPLAIQYSDIQKAYLQVGDSEFTATEDGILQLNDGSHGGIPKVQSVTDKLNDIENLLNEFIGIYNAHTHNVTAVGAPTAVPGALETNTLTPTQKDDLENADVTHGKKTQ